MADSTMSASRFASSGWRAAMIFGPVSGSVRNSAPAFASDSASTAFAAITSNRSTTKTL